MHWNVAPDALPGFATIGPRLLGSVSTARGCVNRVETCTSVYNLHLDHNIIIVMIMACRAYILSGLLSSTYVQSRNCDTLKNAWKV